MTVEELIRQLVLLPPEAMRKPVMIDGNTSNNDQFYDIEKIYERVIPLPGDGNPPKIFRTEVVVIE